MLLETYFLEIYPVKQTVFTFNMVATKKNTHNTILPKTSKSLIVTIKLQIERHIGCKKRHKFSTITSTNFEEPAKMFDVYFLFIKVQRQFYSINMCQKNQVNQDITSFFYKVLKAFVKNK